MSDPWPQLYIIVAILAAIVRADNFTHKYMTMGPPNKFQDRHQRLINFNTDAEGEISIQMEFAVPFLTIPVAKAMDMTKGAVANLNVAALILTGLIAAASGILPKIVQLIDQKFMPFGSSHGRDVNPESSDLWRVLTLMDQALIENNIDTTACTQRAVCWAVKNSLNKISTGQATNKDRIMEGLVTSQWVDKLVEGTPIHSAIRNGIGGINCSTEYSSCKVNQKSISTFVKQFTNAINLT